MINVPPSHRNLAGDPSSAQVKEKVRFPSDLQISSQEKVSGERIPTDRLCQLTGSVAVYLKPDEIGRAVCVLQARQRLLLDTTGPRRRSAGGRLRKRSSAGQFSQTRCLVKLLLFRITANVIYG